MLSLLFSAVLGVADAPVTLEPGYRTLKELAVELSAENRPIRLGTVDGSRALAIGVQKREWDHVRRLLEGGMGIRFRQSDDGTLVMEDDPNLVALEREQLSIYLAQLDGFIRSAMGEVRKISQGKLPMPVDKIRAQLDGAAPGDMASQVYQSGFSPAKKAALAMLYGTAADDQPSLSFSGPAFYYFFNGGSIRGLLPRDAVVYGDAFWWRDNRSYPEWVRYRAVATVRDYESSIAKQNMQPAQAAEAVAKLARNTVVAHRLGFQPLDGSLYWQFSLMRPLPSDGGWYGEQVAARYLRAPFNDWRLETIHEKSNSREAFAERVQGTTAWLNSDVAKKSSGPRAPSLTSTVLNWGKANNLEFLIEMSPVRDQVLAGAEGGSLAGLFAWVNSASLLSRWADMDRMNTERQFMQLPAWTVSDVGGVTVFRNEMRFLDRAYHVPMDATVEMLRASQPHGDGRRILSLEQLAKWAKGYQYPQLALMHRLRFMPGGQTPGSALFVDALMKMPPAQVKALRETLAAGNPYRVSLSNHSATMNQLRVALKEMRLGSPYSGAGTYQKDFPLHTQWDETLRKAELQVSTRGDGGLHFQVILPGGAQNTGARNAELISYGPGSTSLAREISGAVSLGN